MEQTETKRSTIDVIVAVLGALAVVFVLVIVVLSLTYSGDTSEQIPMAPGAPNTPFKTHNELIEV